MRRTVVAYRDGKTTSNGSTRCKTGAIDRGDLNLSRILATMSGGSAAGAVWCHPRTNGGGPGGGTGDRRATPNYLPQQKAGGAKPRAQLGRTPPVSFDPAGGKRVLETLAGKRRHRQLGGRFPDSRGSGATLG